PPSSGKLTDSDFEGFEYRAMLKGVNETLANIDKVVPGYKGQGYEIAGLAWFQGHKDSGATKEEYEKHLVNLIKDLRKDLKAPSMKAVVATVGFHGYRISSGPWNGIWQAQMAVGDSKQHPDFAGNVASVDTRDFWREIEESPKGEDYHYNRNPETYLLVGESMGRAMVRMLGGKAAEIPKTDREAKLAAEIAAEAAKPVPTEAQIAASNAAVRPMIIDGLFAGFLENPRNQAPLQELLKGTQPKPAKTPEYLDDAIDDAVAFMQAAGIQEYDWKPVISDMQKTTWEIHGFDIADSPYKIKATAAASEEGEEESKPARVAAPKEFVIKLPAGMENWFATEFDTKKAGWKNAPATFGVKMDENVPEELAWIAKYPLYPLKRTMPTTFIENDVVLMRKTLEVPAPKEGHRYRIRVNGSIHEITGEAFAVYINGNELYKINQ
ncbi:MAG: sialate O-acetylesterase, partial [Akkermansiaceae bacterium]